MIYIDNNATTRLDSRVLDAMMPFLTSEYGNAASNHVFGVHINQQVKIARESIAELLGCESTEIIFTSGATEAVNMGLKGVAREYSKKGNHIITISTEHPAVLDTCKNLESEGFRISYLPVQSDGLICLDALRSEINSNTILVCIMIANNETGVIQPIKEAAEIAHESGILFMSDATQAVGKIPVDVDQLGIDLLAFSGHKFYGPKGIGGLYVRSKRPFRVKLPSLIHGGGHERNMRSGTLNVPGIVGLGEACKIALFEMQGNESKIQSLRNELEQELLKIENSFVNGSVISRMYNVSNLCFEGADSDALIAGLEDIMLSNGSACSSTKVEPSHVLTSMGLSKEQSYSSIRLSLGKFNTTDEMQTVVASLKSQVTSLRLMNV